MERFFKRKAPDTITSNNNRNSCLDDLNWEVEIKYDPGLRKQIDAYILTTEKRSEENIWKMDLASLAHVFFLC
jgi:hypothetical protein